MVDHEEKPHEDPLAPVWRVVRAASDLGSRTTELGARLVGHIPHVAPQAYLHVVFAPLSDVEIARLATAVGRALPTSYQQLLHITNGLRLFSGSLTIDGWRSSYARGGDAAWQPFSVVEPNTVERPRGIPADAVVVGGYSKDGSLVYVEPTGGVARCGRDGGPILNWWPGLFEMLADEARRMALYFDATGRRADGGRGAAAPPEPNA